MRLVLARGETFMMVFTAAVIVAIGALRNPARDGQHDPCYKLMAAFHKMKGESGTEIVRASVKGTPGTCPSKGSRISAVWVALALCAVLLLLLVFILGTASAWTAATSVLTGTCRWESRACWLPSRDGCLP